MTMLKDLWMMNESEPSKKDKKKNKKDKSADRYFNYVAGNTVMNGTCSGKLSGDTSKS